MKLHAVSTIANDVIILEEMLEDHRGKYLQILSGKKAGSKYLITGSYHGILTLAIPPTGLAAGDEVRFWLPTQGVCLEANVNASNGSRWNTVCGRCKAPAYQGIGPVECSKGCK